MFGTRFSFRLPNELYEQLKREAAEQHRSMGHYLVLVLWWALAERERQQHTSARKQKKFPAPVNGRRRRAAR